MKYILLIFIFLIFHPIETWATTYWVAKTGSDANACSSVDGTSDPGVYKLTIASSLTCLSAGDTLMIKDGTYAERIVSAQLVSGSSDSVRTTIKSVNALGVIIRPTNCVATGVVVISGKRYITFDGIVFDGVNCTTAEQAGFLINNSSTTGSSFITIQNSEIKNNRDTCITAGGTPVSNGFKIINNKIHSCALAASSTTEHGVYIQGPNHLVEHNEIYDVARGWGVQQFHQSSSDSDNNIIRYNYIHDNPRGIITGSGDNNLVHNNIIVDSSGSSGAGDGVHAAFGGAQNVQIYNNVMYSNAGACVRVGSSSTTGVVANIKNNLCLSNTTNSVVVHTGNTGNQATNTMSTDLTLVVDALNNRFSPREGSALIDAGTNISGFSSGKFVGSLPDIGALEAPIFFGATVEDGDASKIRITYSLTTQSVRSGIGLKGGAFGDFAVVVAGSGATESALTFVQTARSDITIGTPVGNGEVVTVAHTRNASAPLEDNICIGISDNCLDAEVRTFGAQSVGNNVVDGGPPPPSDLQVWSTVHFRCRNWYSSPEWLAEEDTSCKTRYDGGRLAIAIGIDCTGANCDPTGFEWHFNYNSGSYAALTDDPTTSKISFSNDSEAAVDGDTISTALITNPHATYVAGKVIGKQITQPIIDLSQNSMTTTIVLLKTSGSSVGDIFCIQPRRTGGTNITHTVTACFTTVVPVGSFP